MSMERSQLVDEQVEFQLANRKGMPTNHDIYLRKLSPGAERFGEVPRYVYFYYFRINRDGRLAIDHYLYSKGPVDDPTECEPIQPGMLEGLIKDLVHNARPRTRKKNPPQIGRNFTDVKWDRVAYIVIFLDELHWKFHRVSEGKAAIVFNVTSGHRPNQSFFDAEDFAVDTYERKDDKRTAVAFINHLTRDDSGTPLSDGEKQKFKFDMYLHVNYAKDSDAALTVIIDPPTENGGTPIKPPPNP